MLYTSIEYNIIFGYILEQNVSTFILFSGFRVFIAQYFTFYHLPIFKLVSYIFQCYFYVHNTYRICIIYFRHQAKRKIGFIGFQWCGFFLCLQSNILGVLEMIHMLILHFAVEIFVRSFFDLLNSFFLNVKKTS